MLHTVIYMETTVVSYFVARPNRDFLTASRQEMTKIWWKSRLPHYETVYVSDVVEKEIREGDPEMVQQRIAAIVGFQSLPPDARIDDVIAAVAAHKILPSKALDDLAHLAIAAFYRIPVLVTWNFRHLANDQILRRLREEFQELGLVLPEVFTPEQLLTVR